MSDRHDEHHAEDPKVLRDHAIAGLKARGERVTQARRAVLDVLAQHHDHLTADEVADELLEAGVHRATVYRALEIFAEAGIVTHRQLPAGATAYHLATASHLHGHCLTCQQVIALPTDVFDAAGQELQSRYGFSFDANRSSLLGTCKSCQPAAQQ